MSRLGTALLLAPALSALALSGPARADEKEWILALQPGPALLHTGGRTAWGGGGGLDLSYGVTDALAVRLTGAVTGHHLEATKTDPGGALTAYHAGAGLTYAIDLLRVVPYIDFSVGLLGTTRSINGVTQVDNHFGIELGLGADYIVSRRWSVGFVVRYHVYLSGLTTPFFDPNYVYFGPRVAMHFGG